MEKKKVKKTPCRSERFWAPVPQPEKVIWWVEWDRLWWRPQTRFRTNGGQGYKFCSARAAVLQTALDPKGSLLDATWQLPLERQTAPFWAVLLSRSWRRLEGPEVGGRRRFSCASCSLWSAPRVHLLWIMEPSLYAHLHILSSRKLQSVPPDITSKTLLINNRAPLWEGPGFAALKAGIWFYFFLTLGINYSRLRFFSPSVLWRCPVGVVALDLGPDLQRMDRGRKLQHFFFFLLFASLQSRIHKVFFFFCPN